MKINFKKFSSITTLLMYLTILLHSLVLELITGCTEMTHCHRWSLVIIKMTILNDSMDIFSSLRFSSATENSYIGDWCKEGFWERIIFYHHHHLHDPTFFEQCIMWSSSPSWNRPLYISPDCIESFY